MSKTKTYHMKDNGEMKLEKDYNQTLNDDRINYFDWLDNLEQKKEKRDARTKDGE